jgi:hypothetical protein
MDETTKRLRGHDRLRRLAELKDELRMPKDRLMRTLAELREVDAGLANLLGTVIGKLETIQRRMPG